MYKVGKNGLFRRVDNIATVNGRKACNLLKISKFYPEKVSNLYVSAFKYSLPSLHKSSLDEKIMLNLTKMHKFYPVLNLGPVAPTSLKSSLS